MKPPIEPLPALLLISMMQRSCHELEGLKERFSGLTHSDLQLFAAAGRRFGAGHDHFPPPAGALTGLTATAPVGTDVEKRNFG
ncbi:MAG: hypothetical protein WBN85_08075 [Candidatus Macondimonas sp.]